MKALKKKTWIAIAVGVAILLLLVILVFVSDAGWILPVLYLLLTVGVAFLGVEFYLRWHRKRKQKDFDEKVSAKEGIEDRRREWAAWTEDLDRQGIDRYELPFYMIVGEPQSGKSVLLQNSDLHFPFGQDKLSGVGGTRGCDWWFTDEAVILDIAGRLFTHEGGVADRMEWEAFLDLLYEFRPLCPANGILLVVPCDALAADDEATTVEKANKIQSALLTLSQRLQAHMPVYLVLTKGDQVFGFAESVHRLETKNRHEMFGWSRPADAVEKPFDLDEARAGFDTVVQRAKLLRERMVATARIPEALPEVDRLYAFPDELAGVWSNLEIYLKRVFTESALTASTSFRGIYLTSGLQTGVPIAKVCGKLLGETGAGDARALESLFTNQRAYFIKDLIRHRVFGERGLVRPTEGRVLRARRNAVLGYGASAVVALLAIVGALVHVFGQKDEHQVEAFEAALDAAESAAKPAATPDKILEALGSLAVAIDVDEAVMPEVFGTTEQEFKDLYVRVFDERFVPTLRERMKQRLLGDPDPISFVEFRSMQKAAGLAIGTLDFDDADDRAALVDFLGGEMPSASVRAFGDAGSFRSFGLGDAMECRARIGGDTSYELPATESSARDRIAKRMRDLWTAAIEGAAWQPGRELGFMIAWKRFDDLKDDVEKFTRVAGGSYREAMSVSADYARALEFLENSTVTRIVGGDVADQLMDMELDYQAFEIGDAKPDERDKAWPESNKLFEFVEGQLKQAQQDPDRDVEYNPVNRLLKLFGGDTARDFSRFLSRRWNRMRDNNARVLGVPPSALSRQTNDAKFLLEVCRLAPTPRWKPSELVRIVEDQRAVYADTSPGSSEAQALYRAKWRDFARDFDTRFSTWDKLAAAFPEERRTHRGVDVGLVEPLAIVRNVLLAWEASTFQGFVDQVNTLLEDHLRGARAGTAWSEPLGEDELDWAWFRALSRVAEGPTPPFELVSVVDELRTTPLEHYERALETRWIDQGDGASTFLRSVQDLGGQLERLRGVGLVSGLDGSISDGLTEHRFWLERVDELFSKRMRGYLDERRELLAPSFEADGNSAQGLGRDVRRLLENGTIAELQGAISRAALPKSNSSDFAPGSQVGRTKQLPATRGAMGAYSKLDLGGASDVKSSKYNNEALSLAGFLVENRVDEDPDKLAAKLLSLSGDKDLGTLFAPLADEELKSGGDYYARLVWNGLLERSIGFVRRSYLTRVSRAVYDDKIVREALWRDELAEEDEPTADAIVGKLNELLSPEGRFANLRRDYRMEPSTGLYPLPEATEKAADFGSDEREWWRVERFVRGLHEFLFPLDADGEDDLREVELAVEFQVKPGDLNRGLWGVGSDHPVTWYGTSSQRRSDRAPRSDGKQFKPFDWSFAPSSEAEIWMRWTVKRSWSDLPEADDYEFRVPGILAPLLLAWSGERDEGSGRFELQLEAKGAPQPIPLRLVLGTSRSRVLPVRPKLPSRPL